MFGLSTWELLIIIAVALIFVGPDQLPKVARTIGKGMRQVRGAMGKVDDEMRKAVREVSAELDDEGHPLREAPYRSPMAPLTPMPEPHAAPPPETGPEGGPEHAAAAPPGRSTASATAPGSVQPVQDPVNQPPVEVQSSRRGANRTMAERDWSEVGKQPIPGRVAQSTSPAAPSPVTAPVASADPPAAEASSGTSPSPEKPPA